MKEKTISQKIRLKNKDETRNNFLEEIEQNELLSRKHKKVCTTLNYIQHLLISVPTITGWISIPAFEFCNRVENFQLLQELKSISQ